MKATYDGPKASMKDKYRFLLNDTDMKKPLLMDDEIEYIIEEYDNHNKRMCILVDIILKHFAKKPKRSLGPQSEDYASTINAYKEMYNHYMRIAASSGSPVMVTPAKTIFYKGMHDNA